MTFVVFGIVSSFFEDVEFELRKFKASVVWYEVFVKVVPEAADTVEVEAKQPDTNESTRAVRSVLGNLPIKFPVSFSVK